MSIAMERIFFLLALFLSVQNVYAQDYRIKVQHRAPLVLGETVQVYSQALGEARKLNVYLPSGYEMDSLKNLPIIYLLDGSKDEDFIHIAGLLQFANYPWVNDAPRAILVGIENVDRKRDFTFPTKNEEDKKDFPTTGGSEAFIKFIEQELKPFVREQYSKNDTTVIIGQSLGGLLATEVLFKKPHLFSHYMIISPSLWWNDESLLSYPTPKFKTKKHVYIAVGEEGDVMIRTAKTLAEQLGNSQETTEVYYDFIAGHDHANILHLAVYKGFKKLFPKKEDKK